MCLALAEGFVHTSNRKKYFSRLLTFAVIAQIPFSFFESGTFTLPIGNVLFTFACSFALMEVVRELEEDWQIKGYYRCHRITCTVDEDRLADIWAAIHTVNLHEQRK